MRHILLMLMLLPLLAACQSESLLLLSVLPLRHPLRRPATICA